jgi:hypothetical protein
LAEETPREVQVPVAWDSPEGVPIVLANHVLGQIGQQGEIIVSFGQVSPPPLMGSPEQQEAQAREIPFLLAKPVARLGFTRAGLDEVIRILNDTRDHYDRVQEKRAAQAQEGGGS